MVRTFEVLILADAGIGNAIQALYALEYLLRKKISAAIFLNRVNSSFQSYLKDCYGKEVILSGIENVKCVHLLHGFTYQSEQLPEFDHYYYVNTDFHSAKHASETEQFMHLVRGLYPRGKELKVLEQLKGVDSERVQDLKPEGKVILYPGGSAINSARRWPHFRTLAERLGEKSIIIGGNDDVNFEMSFVYPKWFTSIAPQFILNRRAVWQILKRFGLMEKHAHWSDLRSNKQALIEVLSWGELVSLMKQGEKFVGNDGGLMHLAAACGMTGISLFGPTSMGKNGPINEGIRCISSKYSCSPCQFGVGGVQMTISYINCPYQVACMKDISVEYVLEQLNG